MITIDEVPLDWCFRPGVKLDFQKMPDGHVVTAQEVEDELARIGHDLQPFDIVLVNTRASECYGTPEYLTAGAGKPPFTSPNAVSALPASMPGAGTRRFLTPENAS